MLVTSSDGGMLLVVDVEKGSVDATIRVGDGPTGLSLSDTGERAIVANTGRTAAGSTLSLVNTTTRQVTRTIHLEGSVGLTPGKQTFFKPTAVAFLPGGEQLVAASEATQCLVFVGTKAGRVLGAAPFEGRGASHILISPDGNFVFLSHTESGSVSVFDIARRQAVKEISLEAGGSSDMALTPDGKHIWVTNGSTNSISVIDVAQQEEIVEFAAGSNPHDIAFTHDGKLALCTNKGSNTVSVYNTENYKALGEIELVDAQTKAVGKDGMLVELPTIAPAGLTFADAGTPQERAFVGLNGAHRLCELDLATMSVKRTIDLPVEPDEIAWTRTTLAFAPSGQ
ncbi:MAG: YncE family protein [Planctomycetes bacterium]|nr:YncE family protein [Planctomycetota bacterium]